MVEEFLDQTFEKGQYEVFPLAGDASTRRYYRVVVKEQSWVVMLWDPFVDVAAYPFLNVQSHFQKNDVHVPKVEKIAPQMGIVLLEDLGDLTLERKFWENQNHEQVIPFYFQAVDELIKIHFLVSQDKSPSHVCQQIAFDTKKLLWEMNYGREHMLEKLGGIKLSSRDQGTLQKQFTEICTILDQEPKYVCHRDYHSRNIMLKLGQAHVIDFQDARLGPIQYDLVSLLYDSYVKLSDNSRSVILNDYLEKAQPYLGEAPQPTHFNEIFHLQIIQRCFKACGSFSSFYNTRSDTRYLKYIQPTLKTVATTLELFPQYRFFADILQSSGVLERDYEKLCAPSS